jgi:hypothetical protein
MSHDPGPRLIPATVERVLPFRDSAGVVLDCGGKKFMIFVGMFEAAAIMRELRGERTERPLTHDVIAYVMTGFDIEVTQVVISSIVSHVFCATLILRQRGPEPQEVRLDLRASDALVIALKVSSGISVTQRVLDEVDDVTETLQTMDERLAEAEAEGGDVDIPDEGEPEDD